MATSAEAEVTAPRCGHVECRCMVSPARAIRVDGVYYCSETCRRGEGCAHAGCACAKTIALGSDA